MFSKASAGQISCQIILFKKMKNTSERSVWLNIEIIKSCYER